jgi:hypothetical protein
MSTPYTNARNDQLLQDWARGLGQLPPADKRVQIKMPAIVLHKLDELYPHIDRSKILTQLVLQAISIKLRFIDRPDLGELVDAEQSELDDMWQYLEERDAGL